MNESQHAERIVDHFKSLLGEDALKHIDNKVFAQLQLRIESAIDVSVLEAVNQAKNIAAGAARDISHIIEKT